MKSFAAKTLALIFLLAFIVRIIPVTVYGVPAGLDSYLHMDISLRIAENGALLSTDPMSLVGLKAYSYPPGFHALMAFFMLFLPPLIASHALVALIGAVTSLIVFIIARDVFGDEKIALFSAFFFASSPIHIFRTSMPIPESFGVLLFTVALMFLIRYLKGFGPRNLLFSAITLAFYMVSHRGWTLFVLSAFLLLLVYKSDMFRKKRYIIGTGALIAALYMAVISLFSELLARINVEAVSALGYLKWMGIVQLFLGAVGIIMLYKTRDKIKLFIVVWASMLLFIGSFSFRFRDPYGAIPVSMLAGYAAVNYLMPLARKKKLLEVTVTAVIMFAVLQAVYTALYVVEHPSGGEQEALGWLKENAPEDSIVLTWKEEGYYIIGISERKDILTWKKIYQGFFEEPPTVSEAQAAYTDMFVMFRSVNRDRMLKLFDQYSVDYIYIDSRMRTELDALKYGLVEYLSYDTLFRPVFSNDAAEIYRLVREPEVPAEYGGKITEYVTFDDYDATFDSGMSLSLVPYLESHWNGLAYMNYPDYKAYYPFNAKAAEALLDLHGITGEAALKSRALWLFEWLELKKEHDGSWKYQGYDYPKKSAQTTCEVVVELLDIEEKHPEAMEGYDFGNTSRFLLSGMRSGWIRNLEGFQWDDYRADAACVPALWRLGERNDDQSLRDAADEIARHLMDVQNDDGSWPYGEYSDRVTVNSQALIAEALAMYHEYGGEEDVMPALISGADYLASRQNSEGKFSDDVSESGVVIKTGLVTYPRAIYAYDAAGKDSSETVSYLMDKYEPGDNDLGALLYIMSGGL